MKALKLILGTAALAIAATFTVIGHAQTATDMTEAEVRKVDKDNKKITLKHGAIKNLDMPPMSMVFQVKDAALIDKVQAGDKVRFRAVSEDGKFIVTEMQPVK
jgi:Cu(I)/Ag(I) efflux system protein CusF